MTHANYAVAPGEYLEEWMSEHGVSRQYVAGLLGYSDEQVGEIVSGRLPVTNEIATRLELAVGIPATSWLRYESAYRADLARITEQGSQNDTR